MDAITSEKYYYIMDYSSHYYRLDSEGQLVAACNEGEATVFSYEDATRRVGEGVKSKFFIITPADIVECYIDEEPEGQEDDTDMEVSGSAVSAVHEIKEAELSKTVEITADNYELYTINWEEYIANFIYVVSNINCYKDEMNKKLSEADKKICDVLHYIELCETDEDDAQDLVELLRVCREKRRECKDEIYRAEMFQKNIGTNAILVKAKEALKSVKGLENRKYTFREFSELFDGGVISQKDIRKKSNKEQAVMEEEEATEYQEEIQMEYEKRETPFDGKENNWVEFAYKQAQFYENVNQYIVNLEIEVEEIKSDVSALMDEIEVANCNVVQGYEMYKRIKELRMEQTKKQDELDALYALTGFIDVEVMAQESRKSAEEAESILTGTVGNYECEEADLCVG